MANAKSDLGTFDSLAHIDWDDLIDTLRAEKCVLFIGSDAMEAPGGGGIETALRTWLDVDNPENPNIRLYNDDGFIIFRKNRFKRKVIAQIKEFYNQQFPETTPFLEQIAAIPFSIIVSLTIDNLLTRTFDGMGFPYESDFYFKNRKASNLFKRPSCDNPLIYNLLGNIEEPESVVLTHGDFFDYLESVFKGNSMHPELKDELEHAERYIFIGLPYEKWYFQLLLRVFSMHSDKLKEVERLALKEFEDNRLHTLYSEEFKIEFFPCNAQFFVDVLYQKCRAAGVIKTIPPRDASLSALPELTLAQFQQLIAHAETEEAIRHLKAYLDRRKPRSMALLNELIVIQNRFNLLQQREQRGTILQQDAVVENNQIIEQLLELITRVMSSKDFDGQKNNLQR